MWTRRDFLARGAGFGASAFLLPSGCARPAPQSGVLLNDVHSRLNETRVAEVLRPTSPDDVAEVVHSARDRGMAVSIAGGRHAMGGQQFGKDTLHIDTTGLSRVVGLDRESGVVDVEAGIQWPDLHAWLLDAQDGDPSPWGIRQKQTGADRLCLGGALAANVHGRSLISPPIVEDVESFNLVEATGRRVSCSRTENPELFRHAIGGYGLFGVITSVRLRLGRRFKVLRHVELADARDVEELFERRKEDGYVFGDFQYATDYASEEGLRRGVFSCYRPVAPDTPVTDPWRRLGEADWLELVRLAHVDPREAFGTYASYYLSTNEQVYWSDSHQLSTYVDDYHARLGTRIGSAAGGGEMITEIFLPRGSFAEWMETVREDLRRTRPQLVYGTVRVVSPEAETALSWARQPWICVIFNLHVQPHAGAIGRAADDFRRLIDRALERSGSYYLTYHRWATKEQVVAAHPGLPEFLRSKRTTDPDDVFQSEWYRHHRAMFAEETS